MSAQTETQLIMMVAQAPFETPDMNQFCKLIPIAYPDGTRPTPADFPNDGEIWWMLTAYTSRLALPGQLVIGELELAVRYESNDPLSSRYQAKRESIQDLNLKDGFEVINMPVDAIENIQDVVARGFRLDLVTPPAHIVMLQWRSTFYGPFTVARVVAGAPSESQSFSFSPAQTIGMTIYEVDQTAFAKATKDHRIVVQEKVSLTDNNRRRGYDLAEVRHDLVLAAGYERLLTANPRRLVLEPIDRKLLRFAKGCLTRGKRQQLNQLLDELEITGRETEEAQDLAEAVGRARSVTEKQDAALDVVAEALLKSGLLGTDRIAVAEKSFAARYVEERTAELQAKVEQNLTAKRAELRGVEEDLKYAQANLQKDKAQRLEQLERDIATEREKADEQFAAEKNRLASEKKEFEKQKEELKRQQVLLQHNLEKVTKELREAGDEVVNRFLTIAPLLGALGPSTRRPIAELSPPRSDDTGRSLMQETFEIPAFVTGAAANEGELKEDVFFDRFRGVVEKSGFTFRPLDLQRFHLSVKCGELTVLGGPSGTGKSSLPALYAQALLGDQSTNGRPGCLMVNINPSWMDTRDLLGHMNTLDGRFYPAESGLFQHLVFAQKENETRGAATGIYVTCLDEMNLSQVEHYFSDFMMVLERSGATRTIQCFSPDAAGKNCRFREWGVITLSPALRFVGTVNFDETTRLLSDRFLDRVNLIRLTSAGLPAVAGAGSALATASGRMVTLADIETWRVDSALPADLGLLLDQMRPLLGQMGCPISPRAYRAICRFVGSSAPIMSSEKSFELQVAQRIIPRIRSLVTSRQLNALDALLQLLQKSSVCRFEESIPLLEEIRETTSGRKWELGE
jgi:energy-coupling factor transporter ATP-binding protein EcfA2